MFVTKKEFKRHEAHVERDLDHLRDRLRDRYWDLYHKHHALLSHLGLEEVETPAKVELRPIQPSGAIRIPSLQLGVFEASEHFLDLQIRFDLAAMKK